MDLLKKRRKRHKVNWILLRSVKADMKEVGNDMGNKHLGSFFDEFLEEEGLYSEVEAVAIKQLLAHQVEKMMEKNKLN